MYYSQFLHMGTDWVSGGVWTGLSVKEIDKNIHIS